MIIVKEKAQLFRIIKEYKQQSLAINFVPTMGNLHQGHIELMKKAKALSGITVASIFVNPMQFNNANDLLKYPRTPESDIQKLESVAVDLLFSPEADTIYPASLTASNRSKVVVPELGEILEGKSRPGHFDGVTTVVAKLFNLVQADNAIFGEKDFQQLAIIRKMVADLDIPVKIHSHPIIRESDGLAMSSRNNRLTKQHREKAPLLYQSLQKLRDDVQQGKRTYSQLQQQTREHLDSLGFITDYISIADASTLLPANDTTADKVILAAVILAEVRLIDNIYLGT